MYKQIYGLSCVENHIISQLREAGIDERCFYCDSIFPSEIIYNDIFKENLSVFDYPKIPRIQSHCKDFGIITLAKTIQKSIQPKYNQTYLVRVDPLFNKEVLQSRAFRPDHYVLLKKVDDYTFSLQNDIPEKKLLITDEQLQDIYDGDFFILTINRQPLANEIEQMIHCGMMKFYDLFETYTPIEHASIPTLSSSQMRDFLYFVKQLRQRSTLFFEKIFDTKELKQLNKAYENLLMVFEYSKLRGTVDDKMTVECISQTNALDFEYYKIIKESTRNECRI